MMLTSLVVACVFAWTGRFAAVVCTDERSDMGETASVDGEVAATAEDHRPNTAEACPEVGCELACRQKAASL